MSRSKRFLTYLAENKHIHIDDTKSGAIIHGDSYNSDDLLLDLVTNHKRRKTPVCHFYRFLNLSKFVISVIGINISKIDEGNMAKYHKIFLICCQKLLASQKGVMV